MARSSMSWAWGWRRSIAIARWFSERSPVDVVGLIAPVAVLALTVALVHRHPGHDVAAPCRTSFRWRWPDCCCCPATHAGHSGLRGCAPRRRCASTARRASPSTEHARMQFTIDNWQRALASPGSLRCRERTTIEGPLDRLAAKPAPTGFVLPASELCLAASRIGRGGRLCGRHGRSAGPAHAPSPTVIVIDDATATIRARNRCADRHQARSGATRQCRRAAVRAIDISRPEADVRAMTVEPYRSHGTYSAAIHAQAQTRACRPIASPRSQRRNRPATERALHAEALLSSGGSGRPACPAP